MLGLWLLNFYVLQTARRADDARLRDSHRHGGEQSDSDRAPVAQSHARRRHVAGDAIVESVRTRIRPILMTAVTTVLGLLPLVLFPGAGSELYRGWAPCCWAGSSCRRCCRWC